MSARRADAGIDDLLGFDDEPEIVEEQARPRSRLGWVIRNGLLVATATAATAGGLRIIGVEAPVFLLLTGFVALRWLFLVLEDVAPPPLPRPRRRADGRGDPRGTDGLREAVRRWELRLDRAQSDGSAFSSNVLPLLAELTDERLRQRHGITRASDPQRARELLGEPLWRMLAEPDRRPPKARDLAAQVTTLEQL